MLRVMRHAASTRNLRADHRVRANLPGGQSKAALEIYNSRLAVNVAKVNCALGCVRFSVRLTACRSIAPSPWRAKRGKAASAQARAGHLEHRRPAERRAGVPERARVRRFCEETVAVAIHPNLHSCIGIFIKVGLLSVLLLGLVLATAITR